jgi:hypothetical protein
MRRVIIFVLAAIVTAAVTTVSAAAGIPANPTWESAAPLASWKNGGFLICNNEWGAGYGPQTIWADSYRHWGVESDQPAGNTVVETYPCVQKTYDDVPVSSFGAIRDGFTQSMPSGVGLRAEAADDVWLNDFGIEVMIWVDNHRQIPAGKVISQVTMYGQHFALWRSGTIYTFVLNHDETSGVTHILTALQWLIKHRYVSAAATLAQVNFGWEIASTGGNPMDFTVTSYWLQAPRS